MIEEPDIVKELREAEKNVEMHQRGIQQNAYEELEVPEESSDEAFKEPDHMTGDKSRLANDKGELGSIEEAYKTIFENYTIAITLADDKERIVSWNKYAEELLGMDEKELFMKPVHELYPPEEWKRIRGENVRKKGIKYRMETKLIRKGEEPFDVEISLCVLRGEKGKTVGSIGIIKDITKQKEMERALDKSEKKFKQLYEKAPVPYHTLSSEGVITDVNEAWCQTLGYAKDEVIGKSIFDFIDPYERESAKLSFTKKLQSKQIYSTANERLYLTKNGEKRVFVIHDYFSYGEDNNVTAVYTIMDDVTELKKAEEELKKTDTVQANMRRLQIVIDRVEDGITLSDTKGNFELFNAKMQEITGYTIEEVNRCGDFTTLLYPELQERKKALDNIHETTKTGVSRNVETTIQTKTGVKKTLLVSTSMIKLDDRDMFLSVYHDITERKRAETQLRELSTVVEQTVEGIAIADLDGNITFSNSAWNVMHGYDSKDNLRGQNLSIFHTKEQLETDVKPFNEVLRERGSNIGEMGHKRKDGTTFPTWMTTTVLKDDKGRPYSMVGIAQDITERKKIQEEIQYLKEYNENILESNPNPMMVIKGKKIEYINKSFVSLFGEMKNDENKTRNLNDVIPSEIFPVFEKLLQDGDKSQELKFKNRDYSIYSFVIKKAEEEEEEEEEERRGIVFQDITDQKKAEEELKEKIEELERYKNVTVGRELTMVELKKEINELCGKLGEKPRYKVNKEKL